MADIRAAQSGDFSATTTWVGGVVPGSGDVAYANTFTVTISDTRTVQAISNASGTGITAGGTFSLLNGCNLTCTNANGVVGATGNCVTTGSLSIGQSATITAPAIIPARVGDLGTTSINHGGAGTLNVITNLNGSSGQAGISGCVVVSGVGIFNLTGNITGIISTAANQALAGMLAVSGNATVSVTGNVIGGNGSFGNNGIYITASGATVTVTGSVTGGNSAIANGGVCSAINNASSSTLTVNGSCQASSVAPAIGLGAPTQITRLSGPFLLSTSGSVAPVAALSWRWAPTQIPTYYEAPTSDGTTKRSMFTSDNIPTANYPTAANVRSGTIYGPNLENTGTLAVPAPDSVALGVATDNTTGTAVLTSAAVQTALGAFSSGRLNNVATVDSTGAQIQAAVSA